MWDCMMPKADVKGAGYPILENVIHTLVFQPEKCDGGYNHHSQIVHFNGHFYGMWSNHPYGEDGPGQRILLSISEDGREWSCPHELFAPLDAIKPSDEKGISLTAFRWIIMNGKLYAIAGCHNKIGFSDADRKILVEEKTKEYVYHYRKGYSPLVREIHKNGEIGFPFYLWDNMIEKPLYPIVPAGKLPVADALKEKFHEPETMPAWDFVGTMNLPKSFNGNRLCEPTVYRTKENKLIMLLRDIRTSHRMYISLWNPDTGQWAPGEPTDIPDSPSLTCNVRLNNGTVLLIGNQMASEFDNADKVEHYGRDPLMVSVSTDGYMFTKAFALRCGQQSFRIENVLGRGGGGQYPSGIVANDKLYVLYSMGKEDIWISEIELKELENQK